MMIKNALFDLDGTIIFSHEDVLASLENAYKALGIPFIIKNFKELIGPPLKDVILKISPDLNEDQISTLITAFKNDYDSSEYKKTFLIPDIKELLTSLKENKFRIFIVTNKRLRPAQRILKTLGIFDFFEEIISPDFEKNRVLKKVAMIKLLLDKHKFLSQETVMIGDTDQDVYAARDNGVLSIGLLNGYGDEASIRQSQPTFVAQNIKEIQDFVF
ncbi:MAG: HAD family hydrolase [Candidatus Margulisiibacteriota bacterium]|jgi:phosphoglycolate phosphatase